MMKPNREMTITIHPPIIGRDVWDIWAFDKYHIANYDHRVPASALADMIQRTIYEVLT